MGHIMGWWVSKWPTSVDTKKCPHSGKEIHLLLLALHQALLHKSMLAYNKTNEASLRDHKKFWNWLSAIASESNKDENSNSGHK